MKKVLTFWIGEFGFELMGFIPNLKRRLKEEYQGWEIHSASYRGREVMYRGICDNFIPIDLTEKEKKEISVGRLSAFHLNTSYWPSSRTFKINQLNKGKLIYDRIVEDTNYDDIILSFDKIQSRSLSTKKKIIGGWGIYEHIKCDDFPVREEIGNDYIIIFPRGCGGKYDFAYPHMTRNFSIEAWETFITLAHKRGVKVLYYHHDEGNKATFNLKGAIKINNLTCFTPDNSVNLQLYLVKTARCMVGYQMGAMHLGIFAPAKFILAYFSGHKWFNFDWQWNLIPKDHILNLSEKSFTPESAILKLVENGIL
jgi:hypothetical protein